jgi:lysozyme
MTIYSLLEKHEGRKHKPYRCTGGKRTIGIGHNFDDNPLPPHIADYLKKNGQITDDMVDELLETDILHATADCCVLFPGFDSFSERRKMALVDFVFQLGFTRARKFIHSIACINIGRWEKAGEQMRKSRWAEQTPNRAMEIIEMIEEG